MQSTAPEAVDLSTEDERTLRMYGVDQEQTRDFGTRCLLARRLVQRGVRFIQLYSGGAHNDDNWDAHGDLELNHNRHAGQNRPAHRRSADRLEATRACWTKRWSCGVANSVVSRQLNTPKGSGRDHNSYGFTMWMAGGGIKGGVSFGSTDELGSRAVEHPLHVKHLHATILHQLGLNPNRLSYFYSGLDQKLVGVEEVEPIHEIIA